MKEITFNEKQYSIPENWNEVTLRMVIKTSELDEFIADAPIISIIGGYTGIEITELKTSKVQDVQEIMTLLDFIYTPYEPQPATAFEFKGEKYMVMESLEKAEFQDWVSSQTVIYQYRDKPVQALPKLIAILCKKDGESLSDFDIEERSQMFLELPITTARDLECFFLHCLRAYNAVTLLYSTIPEQEAIVLNKFLELGNTMKQRQVELGWYSPTRFVIGIYRRYLLYLKRQLEKSFNSKYTEISRKNWIQTSKELLTKRLRGSIKARV
jgi:hypothetical protein